MSDIKPKCFPHDRLVNFLILWAIPRWIKPNQITVLRFILTAPVVALIYFRDYDVGLVLFIIAALTDVIDGSLARIRDQITEWGELFDPVADKLLIGTVALILIFRFLHWALIVAILILEFGIILAALIVKWKNRKIKFQANIFGKIKMFLQSSGVALLLIFTQWPDNVTLEWTISIIFIVSIFFTLLSMGQAIFEVRRYNRISL